MCNADETNHGNALRTAMPRPAAGKAVDPIAIEPVDEVTVLMLVDNSFDALMNDRGPARRASLARLATAPAAQFVDGYTVPGLVAEHGFSALVTVRRGSRQHTILFDAGASPDGLATNMVRLGIDVGQIEVVALSHGHFDHCGGLVDFARLRGRRGLPPAVHPLVWTKRRSAPSGQPTW